MKFTHSEELKAILDNKPSWIIRFGLGIMLLFCLLLISTMPFIPISEIYYATIELNSCQNCDANSRASTLPVIFATIQLDKETIKKIKVNQKIIFQDLKTNGYIKSLQDTQVKQNKVFLNISILTGDRQLFKILGRAHLKTSVQIIQGETPLFKQMFFHKSKLFNNRN